MRRAAGAVFLFIICVLLILPAGMTVQASEAEPSESYDNGELEDVPQETQESLLDQFEFGEINDALKELFPEEKLDFKETVISMVKGEVTASADLLKQLAADQLTYAFRVNKNNLVHILLIAVVAAVFTNFSNVFQSKQISEISFYILYLLLIALCLSSFQASADWVSDGISQLTSFMKVLGPIYFLAIAIAKGSITSIAFYNLVLLLIFLVELLILKFLLPVIHIYIMVRILNYLSEEDYLSKLAELMEVVIVWTLKTLLACVIGLNIIQGLIAPAIDTVKRSVLTRGAEAIPGIGDAIGGVAEVVLGTAVLVKNGIGTAGAIVCIALCVGPLVQIALMVLMYKLAAALIQPISDKRIVGCIESIGEGCQLLMRVIFTVGVLFLLTIAIIAAMTNSV